MSSKRSVALLAMLALLPACGRKEPPQPPPSKTPAPILDLEVQQRGSEILLQMTYPSVTLGGLPIEGLETIEIWSMSRILSPLIGGEAAEVAAELEETETTVSEAEEEPVAEAEPEGSLFSLPGAMEEAEQEVTTESLVAVSEPEFAAVAELSWSLSGASLDAAVVGDKIVTRIPIEELAPETAEDAVLVFGARALATLGRPSSFSNLVTLAPRTPPAPPPSLTVEPVPQGIQIEWEPAEAAIAYRIYRRNANVREFGEPLTSPDKNVTTYLDTSAEFGRRYIYTVTSVVSRNPLVESSVTAEYEVNYQDRFPPARPLDVVALPETGRVRLLWQPSSSEDTQGYWVYRQDPGGSFRAIHSDILVGSEFLDQEVIQGQLYRYYVIAVDAADNQSKPSDEIEVRVP